MYAYSSVHDVCTCRYDRFTHVRSRIQHDFFCSCEEIRCNVDLSVHSSQASFTRLHVSSMLPIYIHVYTAEVRMHSRVLSDVDTCAYKYYASGHTPCLLQLSHFSTRWLPVHRCIDNYPVGRATFEASITCGKSKMRIDMCILCGKNENVILAAKSVSFSPDGRMYVHV